MKEDKELLALKNKLLKEYNNAFSDHLKQQMEGEDMREGTITLYNRAFTKSIPVHHQKEADRMIAEMIKNGIIQKQEGPTQWMATAHFVLKGHPPDALRGTELI